MCHVAMPSGFESGEEVFLSAKGQPAVLPTPKAIEISSSRRQKSFESIFAATGGRQGPLVFQWIPY